MRSAVWARVAVRALVTASKQLAIPAASPNPAVAEKPSHDLPSKGDPMKRTLFALLTLLLLVPAGRIAAHDSGEVAAAQPGPIPFGKPIETALTRAGSTSVDLRNLPRTPPKKQERPELEDPELNPVALPGGPPPQAATPTRSKIVCFNGVSSYLKAPVDAPGRVPVRQVRSAAGTETPSGTGDRRWNRESIRP